jgi:methylated-DNA-[protein]-cysteine S-methyltransferase
MPVGLLSFRHCFGGADNLSLVLGGLVHLIPVGMSRKKNGVASDSENLIRTITNIASLALLIFMSIINKISFPQQVYNLTRLVPRGKITTYKLIAQALNNKGAARAVGNALNKNPYAPQVPCHRVIRASGEVGGFASGQAKKIAILKKEDIIINKRRIDLKKYLHDFKTKK